LKKIIFSGLVFLCIALFSNAQVTNVDSINNILKTIEKDSSGLYMMLDLAWELRFDFPKRAKEITLDVKNEADFNDYDEILAKSFYVLGTIEKDAEMYQAALENYFYALKIRKRLTDEGINTKNNSNELGKIYNSIGACFNKIGNLNKALDNFEQSLKIKSQQNDTSGIISTYLNIGSLYEDKKYYDKALDSYKKAAFLLETKDLDNLKSACYNNLGNIYFHQNDYEKAVIYFEKSIKIDTKLKDYFGLGSTYNNLGLLNFKLEKPEKSLGFFNIALSYADSAKNLILEANTKNNMAFTVISSFKEKKNDVAYSVILNSINLVQTEDLLRRSEEICKATGQQYLQLDNYALLFEYFNITNDYKRAFDYSQKYINLKDSLINDENEKELQRMEMSFVIQQKMLDESKVELNEKNNINLKIQRQQFFLSVGFLLIVFLCVLLVIILKSSSSRKELLQSLEDEVNSKDMFFSIIAHDLRGPIGNILQLMELLKENKDLISDDLINTLRDEADNTYDLLNNLLAWARNQKGEIKVNQEILSCKDLVNIVENQVKVSAKKKEIEMLQDLDENLFINADKQMLVVSLRNVLNNSIKFTHRGGIIKIKAFSHDGGKNAVIEVSDNGIGMEARQISSLFDIHKKQVLRGTENEPGNGLGLILCHDFVKKNRGRVEIDSKPNFGTTFRFIFPIYNAN